MKTPATEIARSASAKLTETFDPTLPQMTERVLAEGGDEGPPKHYDVSTVLGIASLIVSMASLAWTIYRDSKKESLQPVRDVVSRQLRLKVKEPKGISIPDRDRIIEIVVEETFKYGDTYES